MCAVPIECNNMTIITAIKILDSNEIRLTFGVPLEDIFPNGNIHPSLHNLFVEIFKSLKFNKTPIKNILRNEKPTSEHMFLEEALMLCEPIDSMAADTLIWMLRHFLGMLPLPLLPKYTDGTKYIWLQLSEICKYTIERYIKDRSSNDFLVDKIARELLNLPSVNLLLIGYLINFLRSLTMYPGRRHRINKTAALALIRYFSSSLFIRPYHSGYYSKKENLYHPLMLYLIIKWPDIQKSCMNKHPLCFVPVKNANKTHICTILCEASCRKTAKLPSECLRNTRKIENIYENSGSSIIKPKIESLVSLKDVRPKSATLLENQISENVNIEQKDCGIKNEQSNISKNEMQDVCSNSVKTNIQPVDESLVKDDIVNPIASDISLTSYIGSSYTSNEVICNTIRSQSEFSESTDSYVTLPDMDFLRDTSCQTELSLLKSSIRKCCDNCMNYKGKQSKTWLKTILSNKNKSTVQTQTISEDIYECSKPNYKKMHFNHPKPLQSKRQLKDTPSIVSHPNLFSPQSYYDAQEYIYDEYPESNNVERNGIPFSPRYAIPEIENIKVLPRKHKSAINIKLQEGIQYINSAITKSASATVEFVKKSSSMDSKSHSNSIDINSKNRVSAQSIKKNGRHSQEECFCKQLQKDAEQRNKDVEQTIISSQEDNKPLRSNPETSKADFLNDKSIFKEAKFSRSLQGNINTGPRLKESLSCGHEMCLQNMLRTRSKNNQLEDLNNIKTLSVQSDEDYIFEDAKQIYLRTYYSEESKDESDLLNVDRSDSEITEKITTKIGWKYIEPIDRDTDIATPLHTHDKEIGWSKPKETKACSSNEKIKDNEVSPNLKNCSTTNITDQHEIIDVGTLLDTKSRKSLINFGKLKSKMDFTRIFKERKMENSSSAEQIGCKIKYEKMCAARSTIF